MARLIKNPAANWLYSSEPEASTNGRRLPVPRGKPLGGSSFKRMESYAGEGDDAFRGREGPLHVTNPEP